jgi:hypothetical protein
MMSILRNDPKLRKAYMAYHNDGVLDVFLGWCVFLAGLLMFTKIFWMAGVYVAIVTPLFLSFKESVTVPRLGDDELDQASNRDKGAAYPLMLFGGFGLMALTGLVVFILLVVTKRADVAADTVLIIAGGIAALTVLAVFAVMGYVYNVPRWYAYGVLTVILALLAWATGLALPWVIMAIGSVIALTGSVYLFRFLRSHPLLPLGQRPEW